MRSLLYIVMYFIITLLDIKCKLYYTHILHTATAVLLPSDIHFVEAVQS